MIIPLIREIDLYAYKGGKQVLEFHFQPKTGKQIVATNFSTAWLTYITNGGLVMEDFYNGISGNFNLTLCDTINNKIVGTFYFVGSNGSANKTITEGNINIAKINKK